VPTSLGVIIVACSLAFSSNIRIYIAYIAEVSWAALITKPPPPFRIYDWWLGREHHEKPLVERKNERVRKMKEWAKMERQKRLEIPLLPAEVVTAAKDGDDGAGREVENGTSKGAVSGESRISEDVVEGDNNV
jgi:hypothetical protein